MRAIGCCDAEGRYLGPYLSHNNTFTNGRVRRVKDANRAFASYGAFWTSATDAKYRRIVFRGAVQMKLQSAATALVPTAAGLKALGGCLTRRA